MGHAGAGENSPKGEIMHYHAEIVIPEMEDVESQVNQILENYFVDEYDWFQIGGRFTGVKSKEYDPESDPANVEICNLCGGTGKRDDAIGRNARKDDPSYGCNGCDQYREKLGSGKRIKWPTQWAKFSGDIIPINTIPDDLECYTLIANGNILMIKKWDGDDFVKTEFDGKVKPMLEKLGINKGFIVTVDYHN